MLRSLLIILPLIASGLAAADPAADRPPISSYTARFEVEISGIKMGQIERSLKRLDNGLYQQSSLVYSTGLISLFRPDRFEEHSYWEWKNNAPRPQRYTYRFTGSSKSAYEELLFDWKKMTVESTHGGKTVTLDIEEGVVDKLSYQIALVRDLRAGEKEFFYKVADRGDIRHIRYKVVGEEELDTPWGKQRTLKVQRQTGSKERVTVLWFAPELEYMVIRIVQDDNGTRMSGEITELTIEGMNLVKRPASPEVIWPSD